MHAWHKAGLTAGLLLISSCLNRRRRRKARPPDRHRSIREPGRHLVVVATAAIPWMTGTAVNPCLRAAYLAKLDHLSVTLLVPWLAPQHQELVFPNGLRFEQPEEQEQHIRSWVQKRAGFWPTFKVVFYAARYDQHLLGIFPVGDCTDYIPQAEADIAILEEPEHLTWFHHGERWTGKFCHVVGILHTNYRELTRRNSRFGGVPLAGLNHMVNFLACSIHCHKVIKLSDAVQTLPRQVTENVHGVAPGFLQPSARPNREAGEGFTQGAYCLGKVVWGKGWEELLTLLDAHKRAHPDKPLQVDGYGEGEALNAIRKKAQKQGLDLKFFSRRDHLDPCLRNYKIFINASTSDVVATTSLEALAMNKWLLCAQHPCNAFAARFTNTLTHSCPEQFAENLLHAQTHEPAPLSEEELRSLGWESATQRLLNAAEMQESDWPSNSLISKAAGAPRAVVWSAWNFLYGLEPVRIMSCAGAHTSKTPLSVTDYDPSQSDSAAGCGPRRRVRVRLSLSWGSITYAAYVRA
ncbi:hypothetical protein WJX73_003516 [Symbiochloris irregularis]|uniref:Digalactosyldiacylglycerol synthase n=1 Tax=Symbiochloris irregularis TaxID=706552 RepID=A0AAW1NNS0_9CHLO